MATSLSLYRYSCFALFTLCNAVLCCVSVWNLTLAQQIGWTPAIDAYLIALGALGILWMFPVMFLDQLRKNALISRVWFESVWVGVFWVMNLAGAAAVTAILPDMMCSFAANLLISGSCATSNVLLAFSWIGTVNLLVYLCILMVSAIIHSKDDSQIWGANTRTYPWFKLREALHSAQPSPMRTTWSKPPIPINTPQIRLPSDFSDRMVRSGTLKSSAMRSSTMRSATMKSSALRSSTFDNEKLSAVPSAMPRKTPVTANKSAKILQSAWISTTVTPASPPSDDSYGYSSGSGGSNSHSDRSDLTSTPTGIPPSAMYVPFSSTIKPSPVPPRSSSLSASFGLGQPPMSAVSQALTASHKSDLLSAVPSPKPPAAPRQNASSTGPRPKSKRKSNRPPPLDMTRLHSTYGR